jgi:hypothetical protein
VDDSRPTDVHVRLVEALVSILRVTVRYLSVIVIRRKKMKKTIELPSLGDVTFSYKKPKELAHQMFYVTDFCPDMKDAPQSTRAIPKTLIEEIIHPSHSAGKRAVGGISFSNI